MQLVTELIVLATALVGLYKAATFHRPEKSEEKKVEQNADSGPITRGLVAILSTFDDFFEFAGFFLFMLAFPAFLYAFLWIMSNLPGTGSNDLTPQDLAAVELTESSSKSEIMLAAAIRMKSQYARDDELERVVQHALANKEFHTAIRAASAVSSEYTRDDLLERIMNALADRPTEAGANERANEKMQPTAEGGG